MDAQTFSIEARTAVRRLFAGDLQRERATEGERKALETATPPLREPLAQDYAAWRRSLLWMAGFALLGLLLIDAIGFQGTESQLREAEEDAVAAATSQGANTAEIREQFQAILRAIGPQNLETIDGLRWLVIGSLAAGVGLVLLAARRWTDARRSRRGARLGFLIMFLTPFVLALIPVKEMLSWPHLQAGQAKIVGTFLGQIMGVYYFMLIGPRAIALFPGVIRSALTLKTILPQSPMPGWATFLVAPLYTIFLLVVFTTVNQTYGNLLLLGGIAAFMLGPLVYLFQGRRLIQPMRPDEVTPVLQGIRRRTALFSLGGGVLLAAFFLDTAMFGVLDFIKFFVSIVGNVVLLTVVGSDFLLGLIRTGHEQTRALLSSGLELPLEERLAVMANAGFAVIADASPASALPPAGGPTR